MLAAPARTALPPVVLVETIRTASAFYALKDEWRQLQRSSDACLFLSWEWLYSWWKELAADRELAILVARHGRELVAVAPLCRRRVKLCGTPVIPILEFLGSGAVGSDYLDVIVRRGWERQAGAALAARLGPNTPTTP